VFIAFTGFSVWAACHLCTVALVEVSPKAEFTFIIYPTIKQQLMQSNN